MYPTSRLSARIIHMIFGVETYTNLKSIEHKYLYSQCDVLGYENSDNFLFLSYISMTTNMIANTIIQTDVSCQDVVKSPS